MDWRNWITWWIIFQIFEIVLGISSKMHETDTYNPAKKIYVNKIENRITVKHVQTITSIRRPILSPPKQIPIQSLLYKTTTYQMRPATTFFVSQMKRNLSKTTTLKFYLAKKWEINIRQQVLFCFCLMFCLMSIKTGQFIKYIKLSKIIWHTLFFFYYWQQRRFRNTVKYLWWGCFAKKLTAKSH